MNNTGWSKSIVMSLQKEFNAFKTVNLSESQIKDDVVLIPHYMATEYNAVAFHDDGVNVHIAIANPSEYEIIEQISLAIQRPVLPFLTRIDDIQTIRKILYTNTSAISKISDDKQSASYEIDEIVHKQFHQLDKQHNLDSLVHSILSEGIQLDATDIHIEKNNDQFFLQYRVMKILSDPIELNVEIAYALRQKLILMSNGLITNVHKPQDLSFSFENKTPAFCRLSILPTISGYSIVIRVFKELEQDFLSIPNLIPNTDAQQCLHQLQEYDSSLIVISGPVNSGKTSLLYSCLLEQKKLNKTIISIEDPVEIELNGINQVEIKQDDNKSEFSEFIKSAARQNPDVVSFGEIREVDIADLAINTASTGVLSFATIHASSANIAITRLLDMGVKTHMLVNSLRLVLSIRLFKKLCPKCSTTYEPNSQELKKIEPYWHQTPPPIFKVKKGCSLCNFTGFSGLTSCLEELLVTKLMRIAIQSNDYNKLNEYTRNAMKHSNLPYRALTSSSQGLTDFHDALKLVDNYDF